MEEKEVNVIWKIQHIQRTSLIGVTINNTKKIAFAFNGFLHSKGKLNWLLMESSIKIQKNFNWTNDGELATTKAFFFTIQPFKYRNRTMNTQHKYPPDQIVDSISNSDG